MYDRMIHFKPYLYLIQNYSTAETSIIMFVKHRRSMQSTTSICSFIRSHMIRVGAHLVLLIYRCFSAHYGHLQDTWISLQMNILYIFSLVIYRLVCQLNFYCRNTDTRLQIKLFSEKI